ncbi:MAG: SLATT domain-containing protein [Gammaproteobacteria bacterium]|nr:SLATT domain-containing protein [Gammaproteobacteria bacterium]
MEQFLVALRTNAWRTAGGRYNAARRLKRRELFSTTSIALFSALTIAIALHPHIAGAHDGSDLDAYFSGVSAVLGVLILVLSLMEWGSAHSLKADVLHRNAERLTGFQQKLALLLANSEAGATLTSDQLAEQCALYDETKARMYIQPRTD